MKHATDLRRLTLGLAAALLLAPAMPACVHLCKGASGDARSLVLHYRVPGKSADFTCCKAGRIMLPPLA